MSRSYTETNITPSLLDRLIDLDPQSSQEPPKSRTISLQHLKASVRRDLEFLLNSRLAIPEGIETLEETGKSMVIYGMPDFTGSNVKNAGEQQKLVQKIETVIHNFEPRLVDLRITLEPVNEINRSLRFRIEARLKTDPIPEPIAFDTVLQIGSGAFEIKER